MTPLQKRRLKRKFQRFWKEWGVSKKDCIEFVGALLLIVLPIVIRLIALFVSMILTA